MTAPAYADPKIDLEREASGGHRVRLSFRLDTGAAEEDFVAHSCSPAVFGLEALCATSLVQQVYGQLLIATLLADDVDAPWLHYAVHSALRPYQQP